MKQNQRNPAPSFPIMVPIPQDAKDNGHNKDKGQAVPTVKSKFPSCAAHRINTQMHTN